MRQERNAFEMPIRWQAAHFNQRRININQARRFAAFYTRFDPRAGKHERDTCGLFPQRAFGPVLFLAQMKAVVTPQHDYRIVSMRTGLQSIHNHANAMIDEADRRQISVRQAAVFSVFDDLGMSRSDSIVVDAQEVRRKVVEVRLWIPGQSDFFGVIEAKPPGRNKKRNVRTKEAD